MNQFNQINKDYEEEIRDQLKDYVIKARKDKQSWKDIYWSICQVMVPIIFYEVESDEDIEGII